MDKRQRLQPDTFYHIFNRGNNRENIFIEDLNYRYFLRRYTTYIEPVAATYAYCLLRNHFHLLVRIRSIDEQQTSGVLGTPDVFKPLDPSKQFSKLFNAYAKGDQQGLRPDRYSI